jgi:DNA-binding FrmR family transcriptional regulator
MMIQSKESKEKLIQRLKRIEGQVRGVQTMVEEERDCREIMQQLTAIHSAVQSTSRAFFHDYAAICLSEMDEEDSGVNSATHQVKREKMLEEMITLLDKTP